MYFLIRKTVFLEDWVRDSRFKVQGSRFRVEGSRFCPAVLARKAAG